MPPLSSRFADALAYAFAVHGADLRKGTETPYLGHLLGVCALVLEDGGSEDEAIAALLHDAAEDHGGEEQLRAIRERFGCGVAAIVAGCSDTLEQPKPPWRGRKEGYLRELATAPEPVLRVSLADKLYNARALAADYRSLGERLWSRFRAGRDEQLWYQRALVSAYRRRGVASPMLDELEAAVGELERLAAEARDP